MSRTAASIIISSSSKLDVSIAGNSSRSPQRMWSCLPDGGPSRTAGGRPMAARPACLPDRGTVGALRGVVVCEPASSGGEPTLLVRKMLGERINPKLWELVNRQSSHSRAGVGQQNQSTVTVHVRPRLAGVKAALCACFGIGGQRL